MKKKCVHHTGLLMLLLVLQCEQLSGEMNICGWNQKERKNHKDKKHIINWTIEIINVGSPNVKKNNLEITERATKMEMRNFTDIKNFYVCTTANFTYFQESIADIKKSICSSLKGIRRGSVGGLSHINEPSMTATKKVTTNLIIQDAGISDGQSKKPIEYFLHTTSSLGVPSLTWFARSIGYIEVSYFPRC